MSNGKTTTRYSDGTTSVITRDRGGNITEAVGTTGTIRYQYDAGGRLILQDDVSSGERTEYQYDRAGRRTRMRSGNRDVSYRYGKIRNTRIHAANIQTNVSRSQAYCLVSE